jgi:ubiquinone/menaquinone biosynthesis C-methylase UbiE
MAYGSDYLLGQTDSEGQRLTKQAALVEPETEVLLRRAGLSPGMHVLEIGSGRGDVSMLAGRIVRPDGSVLGIERSAESIAIARQRVAAVANLDVRFEAADLNTYEPPGMFDALIGRFVLAYLEDPSATLRHFFRYVRPGGVVAMLEFDVRLLGTVPHSPLFQRVIDWIVGAFEGSGVDPSLGSNIGGVFHKAGLPWPRVISFQYAAAGSEGPLWYYSDLLRTVLPQIERLGLATAGEIDIDTLADRLRVEATTKEITAFLPRWVGGWVRVPSP